MDIRSLGSGSVVCGWGSTEIDDDEDSGLGRSEHSNELHCISAKLMGSGNCRKLLKRGDFHHKLICGLAAAEKQTVTFVSVV